jgi:hypothetical protein
MEAEELIQHITAALNEPAVDLIRRVVRVCGPERTQAALRRALEIEAGGGLMIRDGSRRRTPGGVFFQTVKDNTTGAERRRIFPWQRQPTEQAAKQQSTPATPPAQPPTWEEAKQMMVQAFKSIAEGKTVKLTLIGRPTQVTKQATCVVMAIKGKPPGSLPKGLPTPPANSAITWAVFVATKQWDKVKASIEANAEDELIIEGYPMADPNRGVGVVLATNCSSKLMQRTEREAKRTA